MPSLHHRMSVVVAPFELSAMPGKEDGITAAKFPDNPNPLNSQEKRDVFHCAYLKVEVNDILVKNNVNDSVRLSHLQ